jgi:death on curing protein
MADIEFLELSDVMQIHIDQIANYGGSIDIRDSHLLESAIEQARTTFAGSYLHAFPFEMAAAYLFHLVMNHPFADGNKRTGTVAALVFLDWNGITIEAKPGELSDLTLAVTSSQIGKPEIAAFFESHCSR